MPSRLTIQTRERKLPETFQKPPLKVIAIASGKGGQGKSCMAINLALAMAAMDARVLLFDGDLTMPCIDIMMGLSPHKTLQQVVEGECSINDVVVRGPNGLGVISGSMDTLNMAALSVHQLHGIVSAFDEIDTSWDYMFIDTARGVQDDVMCFLGSSDDIILIISNEPSSIASGYSLIKYLHHKIKCHRFHILSNMVHAPLEGQLAYKKLTRLTDLFLNVNLNYLGEVGFEPWLTASLKKQTPFVKEFPHSGLTRSIMNLADAILQWSNRPKIRDFSFGKFDNLPG